MIIQKTSALSHPIYQYLLPIISDDGAMHGMVQIPVTEFTTTEQSIKIGNRELTATACTFIDVTKNVNKTVMCLLFPIAPDDRREPWNGLAGYISNRELGIMSAWAVPIGNPGYQRISYGMLDLFTTNKFDVSEVDIETPDTPPMIDKTITLLTIKVNVAASRLAKKFDFVEFDWVMAFTKKVLCSSGNADTIVRSVSVLQSPAEFKVLFYANLVDGIPNIMRLMRIGAISTNASYDFVLNVECKTKPYLLRIIVNIK